jgi:hypothetical protein
VLAAAERDDVAGVATFAAPLDLDAWTRWHGLHRPAQWLNPSDAKLPASASQAHVLGAFDTVAPPGAALAAARRLAGPQGAAWVRAERHDCCWRRRLGEAAAHVDPRPDGLDLSDGRADAPISR